MVVEKYCRLDVGAVAVGNVGYILTAGVIAAAILPTKSQQKSSYRIS